MLVDALIVVQRQRRAVAQEEDWLSTALGSWWRGGTHRCRSTHWGGGMVADIADALRQLGRPLTSETVGTACALRRDAEDLHARLEEERDAVRSRVRDVDTRLQLGSEEALGRQDPLESCETAWRACTNK